MNFTFYLISVKIEVLKLKIYKMFFHYMKLFHLGVTTFNLTIRNLAYGLRCAVSLTYRLHVEKIIFYIGLNETLKFYIFLKCGY